MCFLRIHSCDIFSYGHEQGGTHAADGYARATGKVGVALATSGPGATNTVTGIATAFMDSIPLVVFTGQVPSSMIGNDAFQEADIIWNHETKLPNTAILSSILTNWGM